MPLPVPVPETLLIPLLLIAASLILLWLGAEGLVRGSSTLALRLGLSPLVIGLTVVAAGTSMPELVVSIRAALADHGNLSVGNAIGSNLFNTGVILGIAALLQPLRVQLQLVRFDTPALIAITALFLFFFLDDHLSRAEGTVFVVLLVLWTWWGLRLARQEGPEVQAEFAEAIPKPKGHVALDLVLIVAGFCLLAWASDLLVINAIEIATALGVSEAVIGLTIVAAGTSMPELATTIVAAFRREADLAIGNLIGSNMFNILGILGVAAMIAPPLHGEGITNLDLLALAGFTLFLFPLLRTGLIVRRWEGVLLIALYLLYASQHLPR